MNKLAYPNVGLVVKYEEFSCLERKGELICLHVCLYIHLPSYHLSIYLCDIGIKARHVLNH